MSYHLNDILPTEILKELFEYLAITSSKKELRTCLLVCKRWQFIGHKFNRDISVTVREESLERLAIDILSFSYKVKSICLLGERGNYLEQPIATADRNLICPVWFYILSNCPNLVSISLKKFGFSPPIEYMEALANDTLKLDYIQHLDIDQSFLTSSYRQLVLRHNLRYCETITSLDIFTRGDIHACDDNAEIYDFVTRFPKLTTLKMSEDISTNYDDGIDLFRLLKAAPHLKNLCLSRSEEVNVDSTNGDILKQADNLNLTKLNISVYLMTEDSLRYILIRLKKLNNLLLEIEDLVPDEDYSSSSEVQNRTELFLDSLESFTSAIEVYYLKYSRDGVVHILKSGQKRRTFSVPNYDSQLEPGSPASFDCFGYLSD